MKRLGWLLAAIAVLTLSARWNAPAAAESPLEAGYAEVDITPPLGGSMPGYFTDRRATGVSDPLKAHALYLRKGKETAALVSCDLIGVPAAVVRAVRAQVRRLLSPGPAHLWIHATHSHTGGEVPRVFTSDTDRIYPHFYPGEVDPQWVESLVNKTANAVVRAAAELRPERELTLHEGREATVAHYRRFLMKDGRVRTNPGRNNPDVVRPAGEIDPRVHTLRFGSARVLVVIYGLHPDTVSGTRYSADYPFYLAEALRETEGRDWRVLFLNAACGDINHIDLRNPAQKSGPAEAERIGRALAAAVRNSLGKGVPLAPDHLAARESTVHSRLRRPSAEELVEAERRLQANDDPFNFNGLFAPGVVVLAHTRDREQDAEVGALRLGAFGLAAMPGEYFVELAREVEAGSPLHPTRVIGLTNGALGYIPHRQGYREGGYEANYRSARFEPETGHRWAETAERMLRELEAK